MNHNIKKGIIFAVLLISVAGIFMLGCMYFKDRNNNNNIKNSQDKNFQEESTQKDSKQGSDNNTEHEDSSYNNINNMAGDNSSDSNITEIDGSTGRDGSTDIPKTSHISHIKKPDNVKALYLTGWTVGDTKGLNRFLELANKTEINAYVVDIKDDDGLVGYESNLPAVREINAWMKKYDADKVLKTFHDNNVYVIGRLVCFKDPVYSSKRADLAVKNTSGGLWHDNNEMTWLDPYNHDSWPYLIDIAKEAVQKGFDEIQFDYIRFPNDGNKKAMSFNDGGVKKYDLINEFISYAKKELPDIILSADVFGIICESPEDTEDIGQYLELIGKDIEYISPMVYPSHYALGQVVNNVKFNKPDLEPYAVVYNSLLKAKNRISSVENYKSNIRPYLQGFTAPWLRKGNYQIYGAKQIREQIRAVYDSGFKEWIIWDPSNKYPEDAFEKVD